MTNLLILSLGQGWATFLSVCAKFGQIFDTKSSHVPTEIFGEHIIWCLLSIVTKFSNNQKSHRISKIREYCKNDFVNHDIE